MPKYNSEYEDWQSERDAVKRREAYRLHAYRERQAIRVCIILIAIVLGVVAWSIFVSRT